VRTVLLDTQIALWIVTENPRLPRSVQSAAGREDICWIFHQASLWEIQIKYLLGKLPLPASPETFLPGAIQRTGFQESPIENEAIYFLAKLPNHHNDPFDRLLLAHAMFRGWEVATLDGQWDAYPVRIFNS
jgi:PIN domain nuclease of toxin-antitoxin system